MSDDNDRHVDETAAKYRPTRGKIDKTRASADSVLRAVGKGNEIQLETLVELLELLRTKTDYLFHIAVEVLPTGSSILKTIDNERDAKETIRRLHLKKQDPVSIRVDQAVCAACGNTRAWHEEHRPRHLFKETT